MLALSAPDIDAAELYERISQARKFRAVRERLDQAAGAVLSAYDAYSGTATDVCCLKPAVTTPATSKDLRGNYLYLTQAADDARSALLETLHMGGVHCAIKEEPLRLTIICHRAFSRSFPSSR